MTDDPRFWTKDRKELFNDWLDETIEDLDIEEIDKQLRTGIIRQVGELVEEAYERGAIETLEQHERR